jgi:hypothetical protein
MTAEEWKKITEEFKAAPKYNFFDLQKELYHSCLTQGYSIDEIKKFSSLCFQLASNMDEEESKPFINEISRKNWLNLLNTLEVTKLRESTTLTPKQKSLLGLYFYLAMVEGANASTIQFLLLMLLKNGKQLIIRKKGGNQYIKSFNRVRELSLSVKLGFLKDNVYEDGSIRNLKTEKLIDLEARLDSFCLSNSLVLCVLNQSMNIISPSTDSSLNIKH